MNVERELLERIAEALERLAPAPAPLPSPDGHEVFVWRGDQMRLSPVAQPRRVPLDLIQGVETQKGRLLLNTERFAAGHPANHAMLWGARGTGKSALVKAVHHQVSKQYPGLKLVEIGRTDLQSLPDLADRLSEAGWRALVFIDDLSFEGADETYKALKSVLDGGVSGAMANLLVYVTSNRRHLINRPDGNQAEFRPEETVEEQVALPERFGLWLGFQSLDQATWLAIVHGYAKALNLAPEDPEFDRSALQWAAQRGARSGRSAWQFVTDRAGQLGLSIDLQD
jgi:predicted AAA+ superfamily ATPase